MLEMDDGMYQLSRLPAGNYTLTFGFKSFQIRDTIEIDDDEFISYVLPALYNLTTEIYNIYGMVIEEGSIHIQRGQHVDDSSIESTNTTLYLPPGSYIVEISDDDAIIARFPVNIRSDKTLEIITKQSSEVHGIVLIAGSIITLVFVLICLQRRQREAALFVLIIGVLLVSLGFPWWSLNGDKSNIETQTNLMLIPGNIVAFTQTKQYYAGELQVLPDEVPLALLIFSILIIVSSLLLGSSLIMKKTSRNISRYLLISVVIICGIVLVTFIFLLSQLTVLGVGSIFGEGSLSITVPGLQVYDLVPCQWGLSTGFYLVCIAFILLVTRLLFLFYPLKDRLQSKVIIKESKKNRV
jgi:hypothetical protein